MRLILHFALFSLFFSCGKKNADDCATVARHVGSITQKSVEEGGDQARLEKTLVTLPAVVDALMEVCENESWPDAIRRCILGASTITELESCDPSPLREVTDAETQTGAP